jgi:hypothetical protein
MVLIALVAIGVLLSLAAAAFRGGRARHLAQLREDWGKPISRIRNMDAIAASHRSRLASAARADGELDNRTWRDLNLDEVFAALDRTVSTLGQHALYHRLRTAPGTDHLEAFDSLVNQMGADAPMRERAQLALARLQDPHGYDLWWLGGENAIESRAWYVLFPFLSAVTVLLIVLTLFVPQILPALVASFFLNLVVRYNTDRRIGAVAAAFRQVAPVIATGEHLSFLIAGDIHPLIGSIRSDALGLRRLKTIARWISGDPFMLPMSANPLALLLNNIVTSVYEYLNLAFLLDANGVYFGAEELRARGPAFLRLVAAIGEVDAAISVASVRVGRNDWTRPRFRAPGTRASLIDVRHPLVDDAVPNTIAIDLGRGALITGSNMSGKSTFLRTIGVATVMAQTLNTCLASEYDAPVFRVRSCIGRVDDLLTGKSYYIAEVEALLELIDASASSSSHLFLLDEVFRGTNAVERIAAGQAVLKELLVGAHRARPHVVLAATHDSELVDLLSDLYTPWHFGDAVSADGLIFDHRLQPGRATTRNAIALLRLYGAPEGLIKDALTCAAELDRQRGSTLAGR